MLVINIAEAKDRFSQILRRVARGERVVLCRRNVPIAEIHPVAETRREPRPLGLARGKYGEFTLPASFFEPLPESLIESFGGRPR